jgi:putative transposase
LVYVKEYNAAHGRSGPLFEGRFGSAPKRGLKLLRTAIAYLYNNPVEKLLCRRAQDYKWNFLAYGKLSNPYSAKLVMRNVPYHLRSVLKEREDCFPDLTRMPEIR